MDKKQVEVENLIAEEQKEIANINNDITSLNAKNTKYQD